MVSVANLISLVYTQGDTILVLNKSSPNIWRGASNGKVGRFLARLVKELPLNDAKPAANASESTTSTATPSNATKPAEKQYETCRAIDDCEAARRGDLAFKKVCDFCFFFVSHFVNNEISNCFWNQICLHTNVFQRFNHFRFKIQMEIRIIDFFQTFLIFFFFFFENIFILCFLWIGRYYHYFIKRFTKHLERCSQWKSW